MKTIHYPNTIRSHLVTIVPVAPFIPKSTSKLRSALHVRYSIVIPRFISRANALNPNNHYNHGFHNTFDYNPPTNSDELLCTMTVYTLMSICDIIVTMKIKGPYNM